MKEVFTVSDWLNLTIEDFVRGVSLRSDLDFAGIEFRHTHFNYGIPTGSTIIVDGNGHSIKNLNLFGRPGKNCFLSFEAFNLNIVIKNIKFENTRFVENERQVALFFFDYRNTLYEVGYVHATLENISADIDITAKFNRHPFYPSIASGLVIADIGNNSTAPKGIIIKKCSVNGQIQAEDIITGFVYSFSRTNSPNETRINTSATDCHNYADMGDPNLITRAPDISGIGTVALAVRCSSRGSLMHGTLNPGFAPRFESGANTIRGIGATQCENCFVSGKLEGYYVVGIGAFALNSYCSSEVVLRTGTRSTGDTTGGYFVVAARAINTLYLGSDINSTIPIYLFSSPVNYEVFKDHPDHQLINNYCLDSVKINGTIPTRDTHKQKWLYGHTAISLSTAKSLLFYLNSVGWNIQDSLLDTTESTVWVIDTSKSFPYLLDRTSHFSFTVIKKEKDVRGFISLRGKNKTIKLALVDPRLSPIRFNTPNGVLGLAIATLSSPMASPLRVQLKIGKFAFRKFE